MDRAYLSRFILHQSPRPSQTELTKLYRIYWVDEQDIAIQSFGFPFDNKKQIKVFRETYQKKKEAES